MTMRVLILAALPLSCVSTTVKTPPLAPLAAVAPAADTLEVRLQVDAASRQVFLLAGPFDVPAADAGHGHDDEQRTPLLEFDWPVDGWVRGFRVMVFDHEGRVIPRDLMHHLIGYNFSRRQLIHPGVERLFGMGAETPDIVLPTRVGVPLPAGSRLGFDAVWHNETDTALHGVYVRVALVYTPSRPKGIAYEGMPLHVDVNYSVTGSNEFDVPPGQSEHSVEFSMPISGRLLGVGGHLHEHGVALRLEDADTDRVLFRLRAVPEEGRVAVGTRVFRRWLGLRSARMRLEAGRRYRLVGEYDNDTGELIPRGAMAHIAGLFRPDDPGAWPRLDPTDPEIREDIAILRGEQARQPGVPHHH